MLAMGHGWMELLRIHDKAAQVAGMTVTGMPPRTVDVLLEIRARAAEKADAQKGARW